MSKLLKTMGVERRGVAASCLPLVMFLLTLCVVAGVKIVRSGHRSLMDERFAFGIDLADPFWDVFGMVAAIALGIGIPLLVTKFFRGRRNAEVKDYVEAFERTQIAPPKRTAAAPEKVNGVLLIPDASVAETAAICERLEKRGIRFEVRQTVIDNTCHIFGGNYAGTSGNGTRMCIYVHPEDCPEAERCWRHLKG